MGGYRYVVVSDTSSDSGLKVIDLGAGHASGGDTLGGRVIAALKSEGLLNESVGSSYIERHWPPAFKESGAWPLVSLRQSFLDGALTRLMDPDTVIRRQVKAWVESGSFGLASGEQSGTDYTRTWYEEDLAEEEIAFESGVFLLTRERSTQLRTEPSPDSPEPDPPTPEPRPGGTQLVLDAEDPPASRNIVRVTGTIPPETWNRFGSRVLPRLRAGDDLRVHVALEVSADAARAGIIETEVKQAVDELMLNDRLQVEREEVGDEPTRES